jgi:uncharacterized protein (TIGR02284 family)
MQKNNETLNRLLRGELAATETYQQAMEKAGADTAASELRRIRDEHRDAANTLRQHVHQHGDKPDQDSGAWGAFAKAVEGSAKLFGNRAAIKALKEGEEHGIKDYEAALKEDSLPPECKELIRGKLLPETRSHVPVLDKMMKTK